MPSGHLPGSLGTQQSWALPGCGEGVLCSGIQHLAAWFAEELAEKTFHVRPASATCVPRGCGRVATASLLTRPSAVPNLQSSVGTLIDVQHLDGDES